MKTLQLIAIIFLLWAPLANAHESLAAHADSHAPIGIMGDHMHKEGEWMLSYRVMSMTMSGNRRGTDFIANDTLVTEVPNRFADQPMMPPTLRVAPEEMTTDMHMVGVMYAPSDKLTLMAMLHYLDKSMTLTTYRGMMGTEALGRFTSASSGVGDTRVSALYRLLDTEHHSLHLNLGLSIPTGATDKNGIVLTPMNTRPEVRLPYGMQLGSGTWDVMPGLTYNGRNDDWSWGAQSLAVVRTGDNDEGYSLGNELTLNGWVQYALTRGLSAGLGARYDRSTKIDGMDDQIMLPVQTADPDNYGRRQWSLSTSLNWVIQRGPLRNHRVALEYLTPVRQDVNGVQMDMESMWTLGYQKAF